MIRALAHAHVLKRHVRDFSPRDQSVGAPPTFCTSDKCECGRLRAGSLEHSGVYQSRATVRRPYRSKRAGRSGESLFNFFVALAMGSGAHVRLGTIRGESRARKIVFRSCANAYMVAVLVVALK